MNDVFNSIILVILKYIYSLTDKALFAKRIYNLYFSTTLVFSLFTLDYTYSLPHCTRALYILFPSLAIFLIITF